MKKLPLLVFFLGMVTLLHAQEVQLDLSVPDRLEAGKQIPVTVTISKGTVRGFARFTQDLVPGVTASEKDPAGADFSFDDGQLNMVWLNLPEDQEVSFSYYLKTDPRIKGSLRLGGRFTYIMNKDERKDAVLYPREVEIIPAGNMDENLAVDINDKEEIHKITTAEHPIKGSRLMPVQTDETEWTVKVELVTSGSLTAAYVEEVLPQGARAQALETAGSTFTFRNGQARFFWNKVPANKEFTISYKIITTEPVNLRKSKLTGVVNYRKGYRYEMTRVVQTQKEPGGLKSISPQTFAREEKEKQDPPVVEQKKQKEEKQTVGKKAEDPPMQAAKGSSVVFRVQVVALSRKISRDELQEALGVRLPPEMHVEPKGSVFQYSVGEYNNYQKAKTEADTLKNLGISGAFVVAFRKGEQISVEVARVLSK